MSKRTNSCVWSYFTAEEGTPYAVCNTCDARLKRGNDGAPSTWSSTPLWSHLQRLQPPQYHEAQAAKKTGEEQQKRRRIEMDERKKIYVSETPPKVYNLQYFHSDYMTFQIISHFSGSQKLFQQADIIRIWLYLVNLCMSYNRLCNHVLKLKSLNVINIIQYNYSIR